MEEAGRTSQCTGFFEVPRTEGKDSLVFFWDMEMTIQRHIYFHSKKPGVLRKLNWLAFSLDISFA